MGFRIYDTYKGCRVLVVNKDFSPRNEISKRMMSDFNSDYLYRHLCIKQNCYRASLTPKPYRINQKLIKVIYPDRNQQQQQILSDWIDQYNKKSSDFSTCHFIAQYGQVKINPVIEYYDKLTGILDSKKLA